MKGVRVHKPGGPEGLVYEDVPDPKAGAGQAVVKVEAIGLNFAEVNQRRNADPASLPMPIELNQNAPDNQRLAHHARQASLRS